ncbi:MAG: hypothetical protein IPP74_15405 [Alphaproteobacteria bacterium]|nr:hypothetical protein [Alphaproteobacteria bacterium]
MEKIELIQTQSPRRQRIAPCERKLQQYLEVLREVEEKEGKQKLYRAMGDIALRSYWFYLRVILGYQWMDPWLHGEEICSFIENNWGKPKLILLPRGTGKSGAISIPLPAYKLAKYKKNLTLVCNAVESDAADMAASSAQIISHTELYKACFPNVKPSDYWGKGGYFVEGEARRRNANIGSYGVRGNVTGSHVDTIIADDLISSKTAHSMAEVEQAERFLVELTNCLDPGGDFFGIGTRWFYDDFYGKLINGEIVPRGGQLQVLKLGVYDKDGEIIFPKRTYVDLGTAKQVGYDEDDLAALRITQGSLFPALYLNEPVANENALFDLARIETFDKYSELPFKLSGVSSVVIETEAQGHALYSVLMDTARDEGRILPKVEKAISSQTKFNKVKKQDRIKAILQPLIANGCLYLLSGLWKPDNSIGEELRRFDRWKDDLLDALVWSVYFAKEAKPGENPRACIGIDPAFTDSKNSDFTAIVTAVKYDSKVYVLDCRRFKTAHVDVTCREIFKSIENVNKISDKIRKQSKPQVQGFVSHRHPMFGETRGGPRYADALDMESPYLIDRLDNNRREDNED